MFASLYFATKHSFALFAFESMGGSLVVIAIYRHVKYLRADSAAERMHALRMVQQSLYDIKGLSTVTAPNGMVRGEMVLQG